MKPFGSWINENANSIEDRSTFIRPKEITRKSISKDCYMEALHKVKGKIDSDPDKIRQFMLVFCEELIGMPDIMTRLNSAETEEEHREGFREFTNHIWK